MSATFGTGTPGNLIQRCPGSSPVVHWIEIEMLGEDDNPVPFEEYALVLATGEVVRGYLDEQGWARIDGIEQPGACQITFPRLDREAWAQHTQPVMGPKPAASLAAPQTPGAAQ